MNKAFNNWISDNFKGLSAHTLVQFLVMEYGTLNSEYANNMVYCDLWAVFTGKAHDKERRIFDKIEYMVLSCDWL